MRVSLSSSPGVAWAPGDGEPQADGQQRSEPDRAAVPDENVVVACTARVEGASETIEVGAGLDGVIAELRVHDGDRVRAGDVLAVIDRRELGAELGGAKSAAEAARQTRVRILRGSRVEDRERADAEVRRR